MYDKHNDNIPLCICEDVNIGIIYEGNFCVMYINMSIHFLHKLVNIKSEHIEFLLNKGTKLFILVS